MQKISLALALVLVLGCVSAIDFNTNSWKIQSKLVVSNGTGDAAFLNLQNILVSSNANSSIALMNLKDPKATPLTFTRRDFNAKDLGVHGNDTTVVVNTAGDDSHAVQIADYVINAVVDQVQPQQVRLTVTPLNGGAIVYYNVTKNTNNATVYNILDVFVHHNRYYVVYGNSTSNVNISGVDASGANVNTVVLTNNATSAPAVDCVGLSAQESAYCVFIYQNGTTNAGLWGAVVGLKGSSDKAPAAKVVNNLIGNLVPDQAKVYNAGKQYGIIYSVGGNWFVNNNKNTTVGPLTPPVAGAVFENAAFPYKDTYATFWSLTNTTTSLKNYTVQYMDADRKLTNGTVVNNVSAVAFTQYKDGSLYVASENVTDIYLGQVWGATGMSASALQSVFAVVLSAIAALFLF